MGNGTTSCCLKVDSFISINVLGIRQLLQLALQTVFLTRPLELAHQLLKGQKQHPVAHLGGLDGKPDGQMISYRLSRRIVRLRSVSTARASDCFRHGELRHDNGPSLLHTDGFPLLVAQHIGNTGLQDPVNTVDQTGGHRTQGLLVMVPLVDHQAPVHFGEVRVDSARYVGRQVQSPLEAIIAALGDALTGTVLAP